MADIVAAYDLAEREALTRLPNRAIQAFGAVTFASVGYPFRVHDQRELWRYIDVMHEGRFESNLQLLKSVTDEEVRLAAWLADGTFDYGSTVFHRPFTGRHCITRTLLQLRGIERAGKECSGKRVLELGPGSGFLSLLMAKSGYAVDTVEVAQAFALHQSLFFHHFLPNTSHVLHLTDNRPPESSPREGWIHQVPWWTYANDSDLPYANDIITANHALAEFHPESLDFLLRRYGKHHFDRYGRSPVIVAETLGARARPYEKVLQQFHRHGWGSDLGRSFYFFHYNPALARQQLADDLRDQQYQRSLTRKIKRAVYRRVVERSKQRKAIAHEVPEDPSLLRLRQIFDRHIPNEMTPDELFFTI
jgi:SAM-dependent methyltransferase